VTAKVKVLHTYFLSVFVCFGTRKAASVLDINPLLFQTTLGWKMGLAKPVLSCSLGDVFALLAQFS